MPLALAHTTGARWQVGPGIRMFDEVMNVTRAEEKIRWTNPLACILQRATRPAHLLSELIVQLRTRLLSGSHDPSVTLKLLWNFLRENFGTTNGIAPSCEFCRGKTVVTTRDEFQSRLFRFLQLCFLRE